MSEKATGWDARDARDKHLLKRVDTEQDKDGQTRWRWVCSCTTRTGRNRVGQWTYQSPNAAREAWKRHGQRDDAPRPQRKFSELQQLLSLTYPSARD